MSLSAARSLFREGGREGSKPPILNTGPLRARRPKIGPNPGLATSVVCTLTMRSFRPVGGRLRYPAIVSQWARMSARSPKYPGKKTCKRLLLARARRHLASDTRQGDSFHPWGCRHHSSHEVTALADRQAPPSARFQTTIVAGRGCRYRQQRSRPSSWRLRRLSEQPSEAPLDGVVLDAVAELARLGDASGGAWA